jgi:hypothetical protein
MGFSERAVISRAWNMDYKERKMKVATRRQRPDVGAVSAASLALWSVRLSRTERDIWEAVVVGWVQDE